MFTQWKKSLMYPKRTSEEIQASLREGEREIEEIRHTILKTPFLDESLKSRIEKK